MSEQAQASAVFDGAPALKHGAVTERIIGVFFEVYNELGTGFLESVYEHSLSIALAQAGLKATRQVLIPVHFRGQSVGQFTADIVVEESVVLELKAARRIDQTFEKQLLNYLRATSFEVGMLLNFGEKPEFRRLIYENERKKIRVYPR